MTVGVFENHRTNDSGGFHIYTTSTPTYGVICGAKTWKSQWITMHCTEFYGLSTAPKRIPIRFIVKFYQKNSAPRNIFSGFL